MEPLRTDYYRPDDNRLLTGVCAGLARGFGMDATLMRLLWVLGTVVSGGSGLLFYLLAWVVMPDERGQRASLPMVLLILIFVLPFLCVLCAMLFSIPLSILGAFAG